MQYRTGLQLLNAVVTQRFSCRIVGEQHVSVIDDEATLDAFFNQQSVVHRNGRASLPYGWAPN